MDFPAGYVRLLLTDIGEPSDNVLRVVVSETATGSAKDTDVAGHVISAGLIDLDENGRAYEFVWESYVAYAMRNESYDRLEDGDVANQGTFRVRKKSAFLDFVAATTFATDDYPGPLTHWELNSLNHLLDVVGVKPPRIRIVRGSSVKAVD